MSSLFAVMIYILWSSMFPANVQCSRSRSSSRRTRYRGSIKPALNNKCNVSQNQSALIKIRFPSMTKSRHSGQSVQSIPMLRPCPPTTLNPNGNATKRSTGYCRWSTRTQSRQIAVLQSINTLQCESEYLGPSCTEMKDQSIAEFMSMLDHLPDILKPATSRLVREVKKSNIPHFSKVDENSISDREIKTWSFPRHICPIHQSNTVPMKRDGTCQLSEESISEEPPGFNWVATRDLNRSEVLKYINQQLNDLTDSVIW